MSSHVRYKTIAIQENMASPLELVRLQSDSVTSAAASGP